MFKNLIKGVKNILKSPIGQIGIGLLLPAMAPSFAAMSKLGGIKGALGGIGAFAAKNPMLTQAAAGLLGGAKPADVLRNVAYGSLARGIGAMGTPEGFMGGVKSGFGMTPSTSQLSIPQQGGTFSVEGSMPTINQSVSQPVQKPGFLDQFIKRTKIITNPDGSQSVVPVTDFFEKYSSLLKLGSVGATIAASIMDEEEYDLFYDPSKNPYLPSGGREKAFYEDINPVYAATMNQGGVASFAKGGMDNLRKNGMVYGPGGPKEDLIDAKLSNGEFVFTAAAVDKAGGPEVMYKLMNSLDPESEKPGERKGIASV